MKKLLLIIMMGSMSFAVPACKVEIEFKQKDGTKFLGHLKGDEYFSWVVGKKGHIIKFNKVSKNYEYAKLVVNKGETNIIPSGIKVPFPPSNFSQNISKKNIYEIWKREKEKVKFRN